METNNIHAAATALVEAHTVHIADPRQKMEARYADKVWHYAPTVGKVQKDGAVTFGIDCNAILDTKAALEVLRGFRLAIIDAVDRKCCDRRTKKICFHRTGFWNMGKFCTTGWYFTLALPKA